MGLDSGTTDIGMHNGAPLFGKGISRYAPVDYGKVP